MAADTNMWSKVLEALAQDQQVPPAQVPVVQPTQTPVVAPPPQAAPQVAVGIDPTANVPAYPNARPEDMVGVGHSGLGIGSGNVSVDRQQVAPPEVTAPPRPVAGPPNPVSSQVATQEQIAAQPDVAQKDTSGTPWYETAAQIISPLLQVLGSGASIYSMAKYRNPRPQIGREIGRIGKTIGAIGGTAEAKRQMKTILAGMPADQRKQAEAMMKVMGPEKFMTLQMMMGKQDYTQRKDVFTMTQNLAKRRDSLVKDLSKANQNLAKLSEEEEIEKFPDERWGPGTNRPAHVQAVKDAMIIRDQIAREISTIDQQLEKGSPQAKASVVTDKKVSKDQAKKHGLKNGQLYTDQRSGKAYKIIIE
jgi:hypothetical protein